MPVLTSILLTCFVSLPYSLFSSWDLKDFDILKVFTKFILSAKMIKQLRIATRSSALALAQTEEVIKGLDQPCDVIKVSNEVGDTNLHDPLYAMPSVGVFTKSVEQYLLDNKADVAVHSLKDLPTQGDPRLIVAAYSKLQSRGDVVLLKPGLKYASLAELPAGFVIGTSSLRRVTTIQHFYPTLTLKNIRGNLNTRISKLDEGQYDAIVLAKAGLVRLGLDGRIAFELPEDQFMYAPAQAALGIQCRSDDSDTRDHLAKLNDKESEMRCTAERVFLNLLEGGCKLPIAVYSELREEGRVLLKGRVLSPDGKKMVEAEAEDDYLLVGGIVNIKIRQLGGRELMST